MYKTNFFEQEQEQSRLAQSACMEPDSTQTQIVEQLDAMTIYEFSNFLRKALNEGYFPSFRKFYESYFVLYQNDSIKEANKRRKHAEKCYRLSKLPQVIFDAYPKPNLIKLSWAIRISNLLFANPELIFFRAKDIKNRRTAGEKINAINTYKQLIA